MTFYLFFSAFTHHVLFYFFFLTETIHLQIVCESLIVVINTNAAHHLVIQM